MLYPRRRAAAGPATPDRALTVGAAILFVVASVVAVGSQLNEQEASR